jgi:hypothetical protein
LFIIESSSPVGKIPTVQKIVSYPFAPVRAPKVLPAKRKPASLGAMAALRQMDEREAKLKRANALRAIGGCIVIAAAAAAMLGFVLLYVRLAVHPDDKPLPDVRSTRNFALGIDAFLAVMLIPVAIFTKPQSRSDRVNQFMDYSSRPAGQNDGAVVRLVLLIVMLGMLFGEFLLIDAVQFVLLRIRLRHIDRHRAALILEMLLANPRGIDPRLLLQIGENPLHLRATLAYLMAYEWADISPHGDWLELLSATKRDLRHAQNSLLDVRESASI